MDLASHAFSSNNTRSIVYPSKEYALKPPKVFQKIEQSINAGSKMVSNDVFLTATYNARAWFNGVDTLILDSEDGQVFSYGNIHRNRIDNAPSILKLNGTSLVLGAAGAHCYYHWLVDVLPKLKVLQNAGIRLESIDHFILRDFDLGFQKKTLKILGIPETKIVLSKKQPNFTADLLYHVELRNFVGMKMHEFIPQFLCDTFLKENHQCDYGKKIYIARPKGVNRPIDNEVELLELVERHGYKKVIMEGMSLYDQAALFHGSESVITVHGGALTNIVYCRPDTKIIELFGEHVFSYYYGLSNLCGLDYSAILKSPEQYNLVVDPFEGNKMDNQHVTIRQASGVNIDALDQLLSNCTS